MAIYGRDYYGRAKYGGRQQLEMAVDPFTATVLGFNTVTLSWSEPGGDWAGFRLVRSSSGFPITEDDGQVLLDFPIGYSGATGEDFVDTTSRGGWHYYAIFLWNSGAQIWERAAAVDALVPYDFRSTDRLWDGLPEHYKQVRDDGAGYSEQTFKVNPAIYLNNEQTAPNLLLGKFLGVFGWGLDVLRTQAEQVLDGYDVGAVHVNRLALLAAQFGAELESATPASTNRSMLRNLGWLYRKRGTAEGIREMLSLVSGWDVDVALGPNLLLSEDQSNYVNPNPQMWDPTVRYETGDRVRAGLGLFQATKKSYGAAQGPPPARSTSNEWWDGDRFIEPVIDRTVARSDTGDISTWQIEGPNGFVSGGTFIGAGTVDPEDGQIYYRNSLAFRNDTAVASANFTLRSVPRHKDNLTSWDKRLVIESGIPVPRAHRDWVSGQRYRAGDLVKYQGATYEARGTTEAVPTDTLGWNRLGHDERVRMTLSWWNKGPFNGTVNSGGRRQNAVITEFDANGNFLLDTVANPNSWTGLFYDPFNTPGIVSATRQSATSQTWGSNGSGDWGQARDDEGGYAFPPTVGRSFQLAPSTLVNGTLGVTYRVVPTSGRLMGVVFRWTDATNYWLASQTGLYKVVNGVRSAPVISYPTFRDGERLTVSFSGNTIIVRRDGVPLGTTDDPFAYGSSRHGIAVEA